MCRGRLTKRSMKTEPSPKEASASEVADSKKGTRSLISRTTRMPLPPPPMAAFMMMGRPNCSTKSVSCFTSVTELSVPGTTGTPALMASARAAVLSANLFMFSTVGPMKVMPASLHA